MEKRILIPDTDLAVYPIGLGTADIGLKADASAPERVFDTYLDLGGNLIDTAHVYSNWVPGERARSERIIGDWLKSGGKRYVLRYGKEPQGGRKGKSTCRKI